MASTETFEFDYEAMFAGSTEFVADFSDAFDMEEFEQLGINPLSPTEAKPGSEEKVMMLAARYAAGLPLWHDGDCYDHGPGGLMTEEEYLEFNESEEIMEIEEEEEL